MEIGLVYGDVIAFRQKFPPISQGDQTLSSYKERSAELKQKIFRTHSGKTDNLSRPISINKSYTVSFGFKYYEKGRYKHKKNKTFSKIFERNSTYDELHNAARVAFGIGDATKTYLGNYSGANISATFTDLAEYAQLLKEKKRPLQFYLYYPKGYSRLCIESPQLDENNDDSDSDDFTVPSINTQSSSISTAVSNTSHTSFSLLTPPFPGAAYTPANEENALSNFLSVPTFVQHLAQPSLPASSTITSGIVRNSSNEESGFIGTSPIPVTNSPVSIISQEPIRPSRSSRTLPIRFRHSIGSPSLLVTYPDSSINTEAFGEDEIECFFDIQESVLEQPVTQFEESPQQVLESLKLEFETTPKSQKKVIVQRDINRFWPIVYRQKFDLSKHSICVRFAGEAAADLGGPLSEFLTLCMRNVHIAPEIAGTNCNAYFHVKPESIINSRYFTLGQLTATSILTNGRGPECLNELVVSHLFQQPLPTSIPKSCQDEIKIYLEMIENGENDPLYENNILPNENLDVAKHQFAINHFLIKPGGAIHQFKEGIMSVSPKMMDPTYYNSLKDFFQNEQKLSVDKFFELFNFIKDGEDGSNVRNQIENIICDFEIFLSSIASGDVKDRDGKAISLSDILFLLTSMDRIPPFGLCKKIDVFFVKDISFPKISTCSLTLTLPFGDCVSIEAMFTAAVTFGCGYGEI